MGSSSAASTEEEVSSPSLHRYRMMHDLHNTTSNVSNVGSHSARSAANVSSRNSANRRFADLLWLSPDSNNNLSQNLTGQAFRSSGRSNAYESAFDFLAPNRRIISNNNATSSSNADNTPLTNLVDEVDLTRGILEEEDSLDFSDAFLDDDMDDLFLSEDLLTF